MWKSLLVGVALCASSTSVSAGDLDALAQLLLEAHRKGAAMPILSLQHPDLDNQKAYAIQKIYVTQRLASDRLAGFKAGVTSKAAQQSLGLRRPATGVLFESGRRSNGAVNGKSGFGGLFLETEIGFIVGKTIQPQGERVNVHEIVRAVVPVIEVPDINFTDRTKRKGADLLAANVASAQFIVGQPIQVDFDINAISVSLKRDGQTLSSGRGSDAMSDQWIALQFLIHTMRKQGYTLQPGHILITGSLGKLVPGEPGHHVADFGALGTIHFVVR